mgnify:CR=1 FL=1
MVVLKVVLKDPIVYFLIVGFLLFVGSAYSGSRSEQTIIISRSDQIDWVNSWEKEFDRLPTRSEYNVLRDQKIKEELSVTEAIALRLDQNDPVIRRRLIQKLEYSAEAAAIGELDEKELRSFFEANAANYQHPARFSFRHIYFGDEHPNEAYGRAELALENLSAGISPVGDPFIQQNDYAQRTEVEVVEVFGRDFANEIITIATQAQTGSDSKSKWHGPVQSSYGSHLVQLTSYVPARAQSFEQAYVRTLRDFQAERGRSARDDLYRSLFEKYDVVLE